MSNRRIEIPSSHASESLIDLTPTTEDAPDPDFSIPSAEYLHPPLARSDYFSAAASNSTHTLSDHGSDTWLPAPNTRPGFAMEPPSHPPRNTHTPVSIVSSMAGSVSDIHMSEAGDSTDDVLSEIGDGIRTPGSVWTEVDSTVSGDFNP